MNKMITVLTLVVLVMGILPGIASAGLDDGLVAYYPFNGNANDESGNGNDGAVFGATLTADRFGTADSAYYFDGVDDYIDVGDDGSLKMTEGLAISVWIKMASYPVWYQTIISDHAPNEIVEGPGKILQFHSNRLHFIVGGVYGHGTATYVEYVFDDSMLGQWQHVVGTYDRSTVNLYLNGELVDSIAYDDPLTTPPNPVLIGKSGFGEFLHGTVDEVRIYDRALTEAEILELFNSEAPPCTTTLNPGDDIQTAIENASSGDVICLNPGIYSPPAKISINKSITLQGPQAGVDPRPSAGTTRTLGDPLTEAIIDGAAGGLSGIIVVTADNVVLDGLEVRFGSGDMIASESSIPTAGTILRYNIIDNATGDEGIQLRNVSGGLIEYNYLYQIAQDGINMCCGSTDGTVQFNEVVDNYSENAAIYLYDTTNMTIYCNLVYSVFGNDGIKLGNKNGDDAGLAGGSILYNTVHHTAQDSISVYMSDTAVQGNRVYSSSSENGAIYLAQGISDVTITLNDVHHNTLDPVKWGHPGAIMIGTAPDASTIYVNSNNIYSNFPNGVTNKASSQLDATDNWWGAPDGPSGASSGSGDAVSMNVDFSSWLVEPAAIPNPCVPSDEEGPVTSNVMGDPNPVAVNGPVHATANVDDTDTGRSEVASAEYNLDGGAWVAMNAQDEGFDAVTEDVEATLVAPSEAGIYDLCVRGTDVANNTGVEECMMLVVYDPDGGFVTGGGWIDSPEGAYQPDPSLTGKATFGFVSKYKKGANVPTGNTEFQFKAGDLNFHSTSYDWLVVTGSNYARYKGTGTINGAGEYKFMIWAGDGTGSDGADTFRIKIWQEEDDTEHVVYDNGMDQAIGGGNIVVHTKK